jgi:hypothetical protein
MVGIFKFIFTALFMTCAVGSHALELAPKHFSMNAFASTLASDSEIYRQGDEWGKKPVTPELLSESEQLRDIAYSTGKVGGGTGFFIGKFAERYVVATNHHVCPTIADCVGLEVLFPLLNIRAEITELVGSWTNIDLALLVIDLEREHFEKLNDYASTFAFDAQLTQEQELITVGFGIANNPNDEMMVNMDDDCKVFSASDEFKFMADPDALNPASYKSWSFANGCDISHGDSGSAMVDREQGDIVGIIWTGKIPKSKLVQSSANLEKILLENSPLIWEELSYAVPAFKIGEFFAEINAGEHQASQTAQEIVEAMLLRQ